MGIFNLFEAALSDQITFQMQSWNILISHSSCGRASTTSWIWRPAGSPASPCGPSVLQAWWRAVCEPVIHFPLKTGHFPLCDPLLAPLLPDLLSSASTKPHTLSSNRPGYSYWVWTAQSIMLFNKEIRKRHYYWPLWNLYLKNYTETYIFLLCYKEHRYII